MSFFSWLRHRQRPRAQSFRPAFRPTLEGLEDRCLCSTTTTTLLTVTNTSSGGRGSLRYEIAQAEQSNGQDTIVFNLPTKHDPGYNASTGAWTITLLDGEGQLDITRSVNIQGPGAGLLTIRAIGYSRVLQVEQNATVALSGLTISNGNAAGINYGGYYGYGGGILNLGTLTLSGCTISNNASTSGTDVWLTAGSPNGELGGGIANFGALTLSGCTVSSNSTHGIGGGIYNGGTLTLSGCTVSDNDGVYGGGIYNGGNLTANSSTFFGNGGSLGGGIYNFGTLTLSGCTVSNNSVSTYNVSPPAGGGGIYNAGTLTITNCTLFNNETYGDGGVGGGILTVGTLKVSSSTFYANSPDNIDGPYTDGGGNSFS
jgi:hypothetical protein